MTRKPPSNPRGRPREFNEEQALDAATRVFADKGYEGASLSELARAMGINRVSMYSTFGNKEALFRKAMDRYTQASGNHLAACLSAGTAREAIENILRSGVKMHTDPKGPDACFVTQPPPTAAEATEETCRYFERKRGDVERALRRRFERAIEEGELPSSTNAEAFARFYAVLIQGLALQAQHGASEAQLTSVVEVALASWPRKKRS